jgi:RNA polymerase sigma factor (sigma-70 family)
MESSIIPPKLADNTGEQRSLPPETSTEELVRPEPLEDALRPPLTRYVRFEPESVEDTKGQDSSVSTDRISVTPVAKFQAEPAIRPVTPPAIEAYQVSPERAEEFSRDFYAQHATMLTRVLNLSPNDRQDILQATLIKALRNLHRHDASTAKNDPAWLLTIARNVKIDVWRRQQRETAYDFQEDSGMADKAIDVDMDGIMHQNARLHAIGRLLGDPNNEFHQSLLDVIKHVFIENMNPAQYAELRSISKTTVNTRIHRLRKLLNQWDEEGLL